ncbi:MAG TPA: tetratricopeptide repeat protein [Gemmataceae bacterium]|nr:tetratricopeptide repeat protein [Gemmataceae bacterium]
MRTVCCTMALLCLCAWARSGEADEFIRKARAALDKHDADAAVAAAQKAVELAPKSPEAVFTRGDAYAAQRKHAEAIRDYEAALALDKSYLIALDRRGAERFKLGQIAESIEDFNTYLKAFPKEEPGHWRRGISFYYAGKYAEGAKQFYDGRTVFGDDVENAFWHYLCNSRKDGVEKARKQILTLEKDDRRVPMMRVHDLIRGKAKPQDVIETAESAKLEGGKKTEALFYANLYVALNYEAEGDAAKAQEHMARAVEKYPIGHYMWDVANVHLKLMKKQ